MIHQPGKTMKGPGISATKPPFLGCCCLPLKNWVDGMIKTPNRNMTPSVQKPPFRKAHFQILDDTLPWKIVKTITVLQLGLMCHPRMVQQWLASRNIPHGFFWHSCQLQQLKQGKCNDLREPTHILWKKTQYPSRRTTELKHNARSNLHWRFVSQASEKPIHTYAPQYSHPPGKGRVAFHHVSKLLVESVSFLAILPNMISFFPQIFLQLKLCPEFLRLYCWCSHSITRVVFSWFLEAAGWLPWENFILCPCWTIDSWRSFPGWHWTATRPCFWGPFLPFRNCGVHVGF